MMTDVQTPLPPEIEHTEAADLLGPAPDGPPPAPGPRGRAVALYRGQVGGVLRWYAHRTVREKLFFAFLVVDALALLFIVGGFVLRFPGWVSVVLTIVTCAVLVGASLGLTELLARTMFGPIDAATHALSRATGNGRWDLGVRIPEDGAGETAAFAAAFNRFVEDAGRLIASVKQVTQRVIGGASGVRTSLESLSHGANALNENIGHIALTAQEQLEGLKQNLQLAAETARLADRMRENAGTAGAAAAAVADSSRDGRQTAERAQAQMAHISERTRETLQTMESLRSHSGRIDQIIAAIEDIAQQTNLLALTAAIEAARAGENGRGFAVVAEEVRKLADAAAMHTREIGDSIEAIRADIGTAVTAVAKVDQEVEEGRAVIASTADLLHRIVKDVEEVAQDVNLIAELAVQQRQSLGRVNESAAAIAKMGEEQALSAAEMSATVEDQTASTNEVSASSDGLSAVARELQRHLQRLKV